MKTVPDLEQYVDETVDLIPMDNLPASEIRSRAGRFLVACAILVNRHREVEEACAKAETLENTYLSQAIQLSQGKNITEKKSDAQANPHYTSAKEAREILDAERHWVKSYVDIFNNAHLFFRQALKD